MPAGNAGNSRARYQAPDTHAHLDSPAFDEDLDDVLHRALAAGVGPVLAVGTDGESSLKAVGLARRHPMVYAAVGIHPHEAERFEEDKERVCALLDDQKVVAVGEIGLDSLRGAPPEAQLTAFREQLRWAYERDLPVSVHNRGADTEVLRELRTSGCRAILHCFSGAWDTAAAGLELGCFISFAGNVTFPKSGALRDVSARVPLDRILVESDAPVLAPQPRRGRRNEPAFTVMTAEALAGERQMDLDELQHAMAVNAQRLFGWEV